MVEADRAGLPHLGQALVRGDGDERLAWERLTYARSAVRAAEVWRGVAEIGFPSRSNGVLKVS